MESKSTGAVNRVDASYRDGIQSAENRELMRRRMEHVSASILFYKEPIQVVRGEGCKLYDNEGREYLDCYNNVASVGHCNPRVVEAISEQSAMLNTHTRYLHPKIVECAERLSATLPEGLDVCMFVCTGTEANDLAMRIARAVTGNQGAVVMEHAYHGNSTLINEMSSILYTYLGNEHCPDYVATAEAPNTYRGSIRAGEGDLGAKYAEKVDGAIAKLDAAGHGVAALMLDSIFDSHGTLEAPEDYLQLVYQKIRAAGGLCIADEVQSGFGRTGDNMWGFENYGVVPDIVTMGKPMGNGHPVAAVVTTAEIAEKFSSSALYFNTFGGNPVSMAAANAVLQVMEEEKLQDNAKTVGVYLRQQLEQLAQKHPIIGQVRGRGLFLGIEMVRDRETREPASTEAPLIADRLKDEGVIIGATGPYGNVVKVRPPLVFSKENADFLVAALDRVISGL